MPKSMTSTKFIDANVLLEVLLNRSKVKSAHAVLMTGSYMNISSLTGHIAFHFCRHAIDRADVSAFLTDFTMKPLTNQDFEWVYEYGKSYEFEDALQVAVAVRSGCSEFITFDKKLISQINKQGFIKALTP